MKHVSFKIEHVLFLALLAGCRFSVDGVPMELGMPADLDAPDANVELGPPVLDANLFDLAGDVGRAVPDGALPRQVGWPCSLASDCANGLCIDGYCCDQLCDPTDPVYKCRACNVPGSEGYCTLALAGTDPRGLCDAQPQSGCGQDGTCDGQGSCRLWPAGTTCGAASCSANDLVAPPTCDGNGACVASTTSVACDPYACSGTSCASSCTPGGGGCVAGATCDPNGQCNGKSGIGAPCNLGSDCQSGVCAQGVCCNVDCSGGCRSCALPGSVGLCSFVAAGQDPFNDCTASTRASCGLDGQCDGKGACELWAAGTPCAPRTCSGDSTVAPSFCDGSGTCVPGAAVSCAPYACDATSGGCFGSCSTTMQCVPPNHCKRNSTCGP